MELLERFKTRVRRKQQGQFFLGGVSLLLLIFLFMLAGSTFRVYSGAEAVSQGLGNYADRLLRFEDVEIVYGQTGYLTNAQGIAAEDIYFGEVAEDVYLAIYVESGNERNLALGGGNLVIGRVQPFRTGPEKKFAEVAAELGIEAESAVLLAHPLEYQLARGAYFWYGFYALLAVLPFIILGRALRIYLNPLTIRGLRRFKQANPDWERLLAQLELELEDESKIYYQMRDKSQDYFVTENFYYLEALGVMTVVPLKEITVLERNDDSKTDSIITRLQFRDGRQRRLIVPLAVEQALVHRLEARSNRLRK